MLIVGMADLKVASAPEVIVTMGLGSCVGIAIYDSSTKIGGLAHVMLPDSTQIKNNTNPAKFADLGIDKLFNEMVKMGAKKFGMKAKIAGGAQMFAFNSTDPNMRIGDRNIEASINALKKLGIPIVSKHVGDNYGRTVELHTDTGDFLIRTVGKGNFTL